MKLIGDIPHVSFEEIVEGCSISEDTVKKGIYRNRQGKTQIWEHVKQGRKVWIQYTGLREKYQERIKQNLCNGQEPLDYLRDQAFTESLELTETDKNNIDNYTRPDGSYLPTGDRANYKEAAKIMNLLTHIKPRKAKGMGFSSMPALHEYVVGIINRQKLPLPGSYSRLRKKVTAYKNEGITTIITGRYGNQNARKVAEVAQDTLMKMIEHNHQFDAAYIKEVYNAWASKNGYDPIARSTVQHYKKQYYFQIQVQREGESAWHNTFDKQIPRKRPSHPLYLINSDDNDLDLYYIKVKDGKTNYYHRYTLMVVMDAYNDYPLGYAIGEAQTLELVRAAYLDAIHHIHDLTGEWCYWHEIKADRWGAKTLKQWYEAQAHLTWQRAKRPRGKVIEQAFGTKWHRELKKHKNYAGHNITAKETLNREAIDRAKKEFPYAEEAAEQIAGFIQQMRNLEGKSGKSRQEEWFEGFQNMPESEKKTLSTRNRLRLFGIPRMKRGTAEPLTNKLDGRGIEISINNQKFHYDVPAKDYVQHAGASFQVIYDPYRMDEVLAVNDDGSVQMVLEEQTRVPMAVKDRQEGDGLAAYNRLKEQKWISQWVLDKAAARKERLDRNNIDAEGLLQAGVVTKEAKQQAERQLEEDHSETDQPDQDDEEPKLHAWQLM